MEILHATCRFCDQVIVRFLFRLCQIFVDDEEEKLVQELAAAVVVCSAGVDLLI